MNELAAKGEIGTRSNSDVREAFKLGFAEKMASLGVSPDRLSALLEKVAEDGDGLSGRLTNILLNSFLWGPALLGGIGGYMSAGSETVSRPDLQAIKDIARIQEMEAQKRKLEQQRETMYAGSDIR